MTAHDGATAAVFYPSIAATGFGRLLGRMMNLIPVSIGRVRLSHVLMAPIVTPLAVLAYAAQKVTGVRYSLTGSDVEEWPVIGRQRVERVALGEIASADVQVRGGQSFFNAGDVTLSNTSGETLLTLKGVVRPERVAASIMESQEAWRRTDRTREVLRARRAGE